MGIKVSETFFDGSVILLEPEVYKDDRGYFYESYSKKDFFNVGVTEEFVQENQSSSSKGVLRGLHFQVWPGGQGKLVRTVKGSIDDVVVDIRKSSSTYLSWIKVNLNEANKKMLFVPNGFAHGFYVKEDAIVQYKVSSYYSPKLEKGIAWNDPDIGIDWGCEDDKVFLSERDKKAPTLSEFLSDQ